MSENYFYDFFISYNHKDEKYAEWISWILEDAGYKVFIQAWDFKAGNNFILKMQHGSEKAKHTLALFSKNYIDSLYTQPEWAAAFVKDPTGIAQKLIPVRIEDIELNGLLPAISYIDLVGKNEEEAKGKILEGVQINRKKPLTPPSFPGLIPKRNEEKMNIVTNEWFEPWLSKRIKELEEGEFASKILEGAKLVVHVIPIESVTTDKQYGIKELSDRSLTPFFTTGWDYKVNKHGFYTFAKWPHDETPHAYVQLFREGIIESIDMGMLRPSKLRKLTLKHNEHNHLKYIPATKFEKDIIRLIKSSYLKSLIELDVKLPVAISISLLNIKDYYISGNPWMPRDVIDVSTLRLPVVVINSWSDNIDSILKKSFDLLWNHCGFEGSLNYDENDDWKPFTL